MAAALAETIGRLEAAEAQNRRFVADVAHELRTPLAALVAEASILRDHLDALPEASRRAGELLVADVARLRTLVDDLMEISRFDAGAEQIVARARGHRAPRRDGRRRSSPGGVGHGAGRPVDRGHGPTAPGADPGQSAGQRPGARRGHAGGGHGREGVGGGHRVGRRPRAGGPGGPDRSHLRAVLQGGPIPPCRQQRPGPGDRLGARGPAGRIAHRQAPRRWWAGAGAPAACDRIVTSRRCRRDRARSTVWADTASSQEPVR